MFVHSSCYLLLASIIIVAQLTLAKGLGDCTSNSLCVFNCGEVGVIDLSPLASNDDTPVFKDVNDEDGSHKYSFSPCSSFSEGNGCTNTSVCQMDSLDLDSSIDVGATETITLMTSTDSNELRYTSNVDNTTRTTIVKLICTDDANSTLAVKKESPTDTYNMELSSMYACALTTTSTDVPPSDASSESPATEATTIVTSEENTSQNSNESTVTTPEPQPSSSSGETSTSSEQTSTTQAPNTASTETSEAPNNNSTTTEEPTTKTPSSCSIQKLTSGLMFVLVSLSVFNFSFIN